MRIGEGLLGSVQSTGEELYVTLPMPNLPHAVAILGLSLVLAACPPPELSGAAGEGVPAPSSPGIPARGSEAHLDVASWNIEWFGSAGNGPSDEALQLARAAAVIRGIDADVWGLAEIADEAAWRGLVAALPAYHGLLVSERSVRGGPAAYHRGEQKLAVLVKRDVATLLGARVVLARHERTFAGRPPLEARLRLTATGEELVVIVVHMKAFADRASWARREAAAALLHTYLDTEHPTRRVLVIGDWNDDVDRSIVRGLPTPYASLVRDPRYRFVTAPLSARRVSSTAGYAELVDHHLASDEMAALEVPGSAAVYRLERFLPDFARTTSDHYPVLSHYRLW
jgi:endonuclease/exonuclease/phosphatase family metal-dependent hydrolase